MKKTNTTTTARDLYAAHERDTAAVLRNAASRTYTAIVRELQNAASNDRTARNAPSIAVQIAELEKAHESHRNGAQHFDRIAHRLTLTAEERATAAALAEDMRQKAAADLANLDTLEKALATTYTDRADITQEIALAALETPTEKEQATAAEKAQARAAKYAESHGGSVWEYLNAGKAAAAFILQDEETAAAVIDQDARRRHRQNAGGRYIRSMRGVCALDTYHTDTAPADEKAIAAWIRAGHELGAEYKYNTDTAAISMEYRENGTHGAGWYKVTRRRTIKAGHSYEEMTEGGEPLKIKHTRNTYADTTAAVERIADIITAAELTERERRFLVTFCTAPARQAGETARRDYYTERAKEGKQPTKAGADIAQYEGRAAHCFEVIGITTDTARRQFFHRLRDRLKAVDHRDTPTNAPQFMPLDFEYFQHLTESNHGTRETDNAPRVDIIAAVMTATERTTAAAVIKWTESKPTPAPSAAELQAAEERAAAYDRRRRYTAAVYGALIDHKSRAAYAAHNAAAAARVFLDRMTAEEIQAAADTTAQA